MRRERFSSCGARPKSGISTSGGSAPAAGRRGPAPPCGSPSITTSRTKGAPTPSLANRLAPGAPEVKHANTTAYLIDTLKGWPLPPMKPTHADVRYGSHERNVLDFYQAKSDRPTPLLFFIHGGGWVNGDKHSINSLRPYLDA